MSVSDIALEAGVFPSQLTYYFGSKEALFVEAACRELLVLASEVERRAAVRAPRRSGCAQRSGRRSRGRPW